MSRIIKPGEPGFFINMNRYKEVGLELAPVRMLGRFKLAALKESVVVRETPWSGNMILNQGMDRLSQAEQAWNYFQLGTGTSPPEQTDTVLGSYGVSVGVVSKGSVSGSGAPDYYSTLPMSATSSIGGATGIWTEIGIGWQSGSGGLFSKALIQDDSGNPTAFPVLEDEQAQLSYQFIMYPPTADSAAEITIGSTTYDTITRALQINNAGTWHYNSANKMLGRRVNNTSLNAFYSGDLAANTANQPGGSGVNSSSVTDGGYTGGTYHRDTSIRFGAGSSGTFQTLRVQLEGGLLQVKYDPVITKSADEEVIVNQRFSWARR